MESPDVHRLPAAVGKAPKPTRALRIAVFGCGYVGLVSAACLAQFGHVVVAVDADGSKIERLQRGEVPFHEAALGQLVGGLLSLERLRFTTDAAAALRDAALVIVAVGTPANKDGSTDLRAVDAVGRLIADTVRAPCVVVMKSTVPIGTAQSLQVRLDAACGEHDRAAHVLSNPEFLREGSAVADFYAPERILIGDDHPDQKARRLLLEAYAPLVDAGVPVLTMDTRSAELAKQAANAALAMRISFVNEIAAIAGATGADIEQVCEGVGGDRRIGRDFMRAGVGYGGSCFPKDVAALRETARRHNLRADLLLATERVNDRQRCWPFSELQRDMGSRARLRHLRIAIWGLAFKPGTDDVRAAPALSLVERLVAAGVCVTLYDPVAMDNARRALDGNRRIAWAASAQAALADADALMLITEWPEFAAFDPAAAACLRLRNVYDGRNVLDAKRWAAAGLRVVQVGRPPARLSARARRLTLAAAAHETREILPLDAAAGLDIAA